MFGTEKVISPKNSEGWMVGVWDGLNLDRSKFSWELFGLIQTFLSLSKLHPNRRCITILPFFFYTFPVFADSKCYTAIQMLYSSCPKVRTPARVPESCPPKKGCFLGCFFYKISFSQPNVQLLLIVCHINSESYCMLVQKTLLLQ